MQKDRWKKEEKDTTYDPNKCPECGSKDIEHDSEGKYCKKCGFMFE